MNQIRQQTQGRQTAEQEAAERARLELMAPDEKVEYLLRKQEQGFNARFSQLQYQTWDANDRQSYVAACADQTARGKALSSVRDEVERQRDQLISQGKAVPDRATIAAYLIGQRVLTNGAKAAKKQAAKGAENISARPQSRAQAAAMSAAAASAAAAARPSSASRVWKTCKSDGESSALRINGE